MGGREIAKIGGMPAGQHEKHHLRSHRRILGSIVFTVSILGLISLAIGGSAPGIAIATLLSVIALAVTFHRLLPGSDFFTVVFANSIGVYACLYAFLTSANFSRVNGFALEVGFVLPMGAFLIGVLLRRQTIIGLVHGSTGGSEPHLHNILFWLVPLVIVSTITFILPISDLDTISQTYWLLTSMGAISLVALLSSRDIAVFLLETGILFQDFFAHASRLAKPAFALLTCCSLTIIVFASMFTIIDRFAATPHFTISGVNRKLTMADGLYLSVSTLSTGGYSDIVAVTSLGRMLMSIETLSGVMLVLFGVEAILASGRRK